MFAVVFQHVLYNNNICGMDVFRWHIPGFLLISGYFGVKFKVEKIIKLILIAWLCYWLTLPFQTDYSWLALILPHGGWFLPFYCVLMIISPVFNAALESSVNQKRIAVSVGLLVLIGWIPSFSDNSHLRMICVPGMQGNGLLMMLALYVMGALLRCFAVEKRFCCAWWCVCFVFGIACCYGMGLIFPTACNYASPISMLTAVSGFCMFMTLPHIEGRFAKIINFIAPSMFSVYLIHECCIKRFQYLSTGGDVLDALLRAILLFVGCVGIDMMRRFIMFNASKIWSVAIRRGC